MCNNFYLQERQVEEHRRDLQHEADQQRVVAVLPGQRRRGQIYRAPKEVSLCVSIYFPRDHDFWLL